MLGLNAPPPSPVQGAPSPVGRRPWSRWKKLGYLLLAGVSLVGIGWLTAQPTIPSEERSQRLTATDKVGEVGNPFVPIPRDPPPPLMPVAATPPGLPVPSPNRGWTMPNMAPSVPVRPVPITGFQAQSGGTVPSGGQGGTAGMVAAGGSDVLSDRLNAGDDAETAVATMLPDRNLFLTMGTPMPCITEQPIRTDVPGPFRCKVPTSVYSTSGAVPLLDPGTWIVGRVSDPLSRGMERAFAVVTRLETPQGCLVKLRAPVGDQLGTAGIDGTVDTHFWERFKGIAMIALLDAAGQAAAIAASRAIGNETGVTFNQFQSGGRQLGEGTFSSDAAIPPTLSTPQARNLVVMAMQDIDMRRCFTLRTTR
jgi:type IV secretion system protein VirB10